jgi:hypothetical protein
MFQQEDIDRLSEIKTEMQDLIHEALEIVRSSGNKFEYDRAKAYWYAQIVMALSDDHDYLGGSMATMEGAIKNLQEDKDEEDDEEDDEEEEDPGEGEEAVSS